MSLTFERLYPYIVGVGAGVAYLLFAPSFPVGSNAAPSLFAAIISIAAIAIGFLATVKSIILSIGDKPIILKLKTSGTYRLLIGYLMWATIWSFVLTGTSIICFLPDLNSPALWHRFLFALWIVNITIATATCFRVIHILGKILDAKD